MTLAARQALLLAVVLVFPGGAQSGPPVYQSPLSQPLGPRLGGGLDDGGSRDEMDQEKRLQGLNADRQRALVSDTNKLLKLANELNAELSSANADSLTPAQLHKLGEIEKLARSVKEKMSTSVRPAFRPEMVPLIR